MLIDGCAGRADPRTSPSATATNGTPATTSTPPASSPAPSPSTEAETTEVTAAPSRPRSQANRADGDHGRLRRSSAASRSRSTVTCSMARSRPACKALRRASRLEPPRFPKKPPEDKPFPKDRDVSFPYPKPGKIEEAPMEIRAEEITKVLKQQLAGFTAGTDTAEDRNGPLGR
jgi:hypothetical protein